MIKDFLVYHEYTVHMTDVLGVRAKLKKVFVLDPDCFIRKIEDFVG